MKKFMCAMVFAAIVSIGMVAEAAISVDDEAIQNVGIFGCGRQAIVVQRQRLVVPRVRQRVVVAPQAIVVPQQVVAPLYVQPQAVIVPQQQLIVPQVQSQLLFVR